MKFYFEVVSTNNTQAEPMKSFLRLCFINLVVLVTMLGFVSYSLPLLYFARNIVKPYLDTHKSAKSKSLLPNYQGIDWVEKHFIEERETSSIYYDYIGWKKIPFHGDTINIDENGVRHTSNTNTHGNKVFFFGGSTMWGTGVNDINTIPSLYNKITHANATNFGESAWTAHQSLNMLQKLYAQGERPDIVIFYDGVNDVHKCRTELTFFSSQREPKIRNNILPDYIYSYSYLFEPIIRLMASSGEEATESDYYYDCDRNQKKAEAIADALYIDWLSAKQLVEWYGGKFYAVLQPLAYTGRPRLDHLPDLLKKAKGLDKQYNTVYPLILETLRNNQFQFLDFTPIFDMDEYFYIDHCHVSPNGNQLVAEHLAASIGMLENNLSDLLLGN